ncbi:d-alanine--poly(Phosphoribitol) ligase subunit 2 [Clostridium sp. CAG:575]|nr:d-alanine--poly(Phosphoribitol) ligase subunit 2 [Clostridium sp. CAG:575]
MDIIKDVTNYDELTIDNDINLIENNIIDSLAFIELIAQLEDIFNIEIQPSQVQNYTWRTVKNIIEMVKEKIGRE